MAVLVHCTVCTCTRTWRFLYIGWLLTFRPEGRSQPRELWFSIYSCIWKKEERLIRGKIKRYCPHANSTSAQPEVPHLYKWDGHKLPVIHRRKSRNMYMSRGRSSFTCTAMNISLTVAPPLMERSYQSIPSGILTARTEWYWELWGLAVTWWP